MLNFKKIKGNFIHKTAVINWKKIKIGKGNIIGPYVVIGNSAQWPKKKSFGLIYIGNNNTFNEFCNIHLPTSLTKKTYIGNNNYFMNSTTIDHDCYIEDNVTLSSNVLLGGNVYIMNGSNLGIRTIVHQNQLIGSYSLIGMGSIIVKKNIIQPGYIYYGRPIKRSKINKIGLKKNKIDNKTLAKEKKRFITIKNNRF
jgi:UDP-N-acetylglucosamine acyltransferase